MHVKISNMHVKIGPNVGMSFFSNMHVRSVTCQKSHVNMQKNTCQHAAPFPDDVVGGMESRCVHQGTILFTDQSLAILRS
jgi:hypothetical protein